MIGSLLVAAFFLASLLLVVELLSMREEDYVSARAHEIRESELVEVFGARRR